MFSRFSFICSSSPGLNHLLGTSPLHPEILKWADDGLWTQLLVTVERCDTLLCRNAEDFQKTQQPLYSSDVNDSSVRFSFRQGRALSKMPNPCNMINHLVPLLYCTDKLVQSPSTHAQLWFWSTRLHMDLGLCGNVDGIMSFLKHEITVSI